VASVTQICLFSLDWRSPSHAGTQTRDLLLKKKHEPNSKRFDMQSCSQIQFFFSCTACRSMVDPMMDLCRASCCSLGVWATREFRTVDLVRSPLLGFPGQSGILLQTAPYVLEASEVPIFRNSTTIGATEEHEW